jgi:cytochrome c
MKKFLFTAAALAVFSSIGAAGAAPMPPTKAAKETPVSRGEVLARENCASCHAIGIKGDSPNAKSPAFRTLGKRYPLEALEEALAEGIVVGHGEAGMPHFVFEPNDIADLIAYLKRINRR